MDGHLDNILILGAGQYSYVVEDIVRLTGLYEEIGVLDDCSPVGGRVAGTFADAERLRGTFSCAAIAIGNTTVRSALAAYLLQLGYSLPVLRHPTAWASPSAQLAPGCVLEAHTTINANAVLGQCTFICAGAVVNHNAKVGAFCQIDCNAVVNARDVVPDKTKVPAGTVFG